MFNPARLQSVLRTATALLVASLVSACTGELNELEKVLQKGEFTVLTRNAGTTYYEGGNGPTGLEYDLVKGFADELGVKARFVIADNVKELLNMLAEEKAHFAAAGLTVTEPRMRWLRFTPSYQSVSQQLIYRRGKKRPKNLGELDGHLEVVANSSHAERLKRLHHRYGNLDWSENDELESDDLLTLVAVQFLDYTIADSNEFTLNQRFIPELKVAFEVGEPQSLAWAFPKGADPSLYQAAIDYFIGLIQSGKLAKLIERHYGHLDRFDYVGTRTYRRHIAERLPEYRKVFEYVGKETGLDWRLLAAIAYQESHWNPKAVSPTGVRGMMMLTKETAEYIGVEKRTDPVQSIRGGSFYFRKLLEKFPQRITDPDRTWLALAAYNIGFGHLEDTRIITQQLGGNPDSWKDVKVHLPKLRQRKWYKNTRRGYARGNEALRYVENIRSYYDILVWMDEQERARARELQPKPPAALTIDTPAL